MVRRRLRLMILFLIGFVVVALFSLWGERQSGLYVDSSRAAVITQLQELSRFETASFTIEKIIDAGTEGGAIEQFLFGDRILLIAHGQVIAGFDLYQLSADSLVVDGDRVQLALPQPVILVTSLDNQQTRVYDRQQGLLSRGETNLEAEARAEAEVTIRQAACDGGILDEAAKNAHKQLTALLQALGFAEVEIQIPEGNC